MSRIIGVDIGGTFTDLILHDSNSQQSFVHKVPSTGDDPSRGMMAGIDEICVKAGTTIDAIDLLMHGTTIATNAMLENRGAKAGFITTEGFRDVLHIGRHQRPQHYSVMQDIPWQSQPMVRRRYRRTVEERISFPGKVEVPLNEEQVHAAADFFITEGVESVGIGFINSYLNDAHEQRAREILHERMPEAFLATSSELSAQFREFERFTTTAISAFIGPGVANYLERLQTRLEQAGFTGTVHLMMSNGGMATVASASAKPITLLQSGPAAGVLGGQWCAVKSDRRKLITFDMGGTSADIGIVDDDKVLEAMSRDTWIAGYPVLAPMLDVYTIGAGGGSIAFRDRGGAFRVGPRSAGARPGPACYGFGGVEATVTDAHLVLGRISVDRFLGGGMALDAEAAEAAVARLADEVQMGVEETAEGILAIANNAMAAAIRSRTVERGRDPREFTLVAFGGAGPLHACDVAEILGMREVLVPPYPGINAAVGLITSDLRYDLMLTLFERADGVVLSAMKERMDNAVSEFAAQLAVDGIDVESAAIEFELECRYIGQGYEIRVPLAADDSGTPSVDEAIAAFHDAHEREYGHSFPHDPVEIVNLRATATSRRHAVDSLPVRHTDESPGKIGTAEGVFRSNGVLERVTYDMWDRVRLVVDEPIAGPCVIYQSDTTIVVPPAWVATVDENSNLLLTRAAVE